MAIEARDLNTNFMVLDMKAKVSEALAAVGDNDDVYIVVKYASGQYASIQASELRKGLAGFSRLNDRIAMSNATLGDLLEKFAVQAVDQDSTELWQAENIRKTVPTQSLVVLAKGSVVGLLTPRVEAPTVFRGERTRGGILSAAEPMGEPPAEDAEPAKKINIQLVDQELVRLNPEEQPLQMSQTYTLIIDIADESKPTSIIGDVLLKYKWQSGEQEVTLTVRLESDDFEILTEPQKVKIPRLGESNKARFDMKPKKEGRGVVNVLFFKDDLFIQLLTLKFTTVDGAMFSQEASGKTLSAAFTAQPRSLSLTILEGVGGFQLILTGAVAAMARLPITREALDHKITEVRETLRKEVVFFQDPGTKKYTFQEVIDIPSSTRDTALRRMAEVGYRLYQDIFYSLDADAQANLLGDKIREIARKEQKLHIQVFSQHFMMPWGLLYMASDEEYDPQQVNPEWFLGLKHVIEHIPLQQTMLVTDAAIESQDGLTVSINVNKDIDAQMGAPLVASQVDYWKKQEGVKLVQRQSSAELIEALRSTQSTADQVVYFYCHAVSKDLQEGGPDASTLVLSKSDKVTLKDLKLQASPKRPLPGEPLVFINACESAELSPLFYDGFVPYFLAKGARGVIGTECETPAIFAVEWATQFFDHFLKGERVGEIALELRKGFLNEHKNPLGLLYALYVDGDTQIVPGLTQ